jgi:DNA-binding transcriptional regulator YiaG
VSKDTIKLWEKGKVTPSIRFLPVIFRFLGYYPFPKPVSLSERILAARRQLGITQKELSRILKVDPSSVRNWESGKRKPTKRLKKRLYDIRVFHLCEKS